MTLGSPWASRVGLDVAAWLRRSGALAFVLLLLVTPTRAAAEPARYAWVPPAALRLERPLAPPASAARGRASQPNRSRPPAEIVDPARAVTLEPGALLYAAVDAGSMVRVEGRGAELGWGSGTGTLPDAVTYVPSHPGDVARELTVPAYGTARFLVVRAADPTPCRVRVWIAAPLRRPLTWYRTDLAVHAWIFEAGALPALDGELAPLAPSLRLLAALARALGPALAGEGAKAWLEARWLELTFAARPMDVPFSVAVRVDGKGGRPLPESIRKALGLDDESEHRLLSGNERLLLTSDSAAVVTLLLRPRALGRSVTRVLEGDTLRESLEVKIPRRAEETSRFAAPAVRRVPIAPAVPVSVELDRGESIVSFRGYRQQRGLFEPSLLRARVRLLTEARANAPATPAGRALAALVDFTLHRSRSASLALRSMASDPALDLGLRAVLFEELATHALADVAPPSDALADLHSITTALAPDLALSFERAALESAARRGERRARGSLDRALPPSFTVPAEREDVTVVAALGELLAPPPDRGRPLHGARLDALVSEVGPRDDLAELAHRVWLEAGLWTWAEPLDGSGVVTKLRPVYDAQPGERCPVEAPEGLRWTHIDETPLDLVLGAGSGTHAWVPVRPESERMLPESLLAVDDVRVGVHGGAGLQSVLAVTPGAHRFVVESGTPVLARLPLTEPVPCERLREVERWVYVEKSARFALSGAGVPGAASVIVDPESLARGTRHFEIALAGARFQGDIGGAATGELELPVAADATELELSVSAPTLVRVRQRLHPPGESHAVRPKTLERPPSFEQALETLRSATRFLRLAATRDGQKKLRLERAQALDALGYPRLAALDRARAGVAVDLAAASPEKGAEYFELPEASPAVVPLGHLAKIPPLPLPSDERALASALAAQARGEPARAVLAALGSSADASSAADALLLATRAEEVGAVAVAAAAYERIGEAHGSGEALAQAALLLTDRAVQEQAPGLSVRAYALARRAEALGAVASATLGRVDQALTWQRTELDAAAGVTWLEHARVVGKERSPSERVKSALLDAPEITPLFSGPELRLGLARSIGKSLEVSSVCHALDGRREDCNYRLLLDGRPASCTPVDPPPPNDGVARPTRCQLELPLDARKLVILTPDGEQTTGWVEVKRVLGGDALPLTVVGRWYELVPERPAHLAVLGPTVLRIAARGYDGAAPPLTVTARSLATPERVEEQTLSLDAAPDPYSRRADTKVPVTKEVSGFVAVPFEGPAQVSFAAQGRVLVVVDRAVVVGLPRGRAAVAAAPAVPPPASPVAAAPRERRPTVGWDRVPGPLTLRGYVTAMTDRFDSGDVDLSEAEVDRRTSYAELGAVALREVFRDRAWIQGGLFGRLRSGPASYGAEAALEVSPDGLVPGGFVRGRYAVQRADGATYRGGIGSVGVLNQVILDPTFYLSPLVSVVLRDADSRAAAEPAADPDVYTSYNDSHPWSFDTGLYASQRAAVDLLLRYGVLTRFLPELNGLDKADVVARARLLAGSDLAPAVELATVVSYRPEGPERRYGFWRVNVRPEVLFWRWAGDERLSARAALGYSADFPWWAGRGSELVGEVTLASDFTFGRGLTDFARVERPFSERLVEGADLPERAPPPSDPYWVEP